LLLKTPKYDLLIRTSPCPLAIYVKLIKFAWILAANPSSASVIAKESCGFNSRVEKFR